MAWDKFVNSLKKKYNELNFEQQWPPVGGDRLINLQLVETDKRKGFGSEMRHSISFNELFNDKKRTIRKVIVEGHAGLGKTTLCTMLAKRWASGKILTQFDCVLLLPLRERSVSTAAINDLPQLIKLFHSDEEIHKPVIKNVKKEEGEGILIIADGWDELSISHQCVEDSFLYKLFFGKLFPFVSILLTSRPSASAPFHDLPTVNRLVEVVGFNEENVKQYIESEFDKCPEKASSLIEQLENNPVIQSVCSVPLNCAIVCHLWHTLYLNGEFPKTLTKFYIKLVLNLILNGLKRSDIESPTSLQSFDSIPVDDQEMLWISCKFAFQCLSENKVVFSGDEVKSYFPQMLEDKLLCLGLLQRAQSLLPVGHGLSFHFTHLTIQEFLAALHFVTLPSEEQLRICVKITGNNRFYMMWRFVFGLVCKRNYCSEKVTILENEKIDKLLSEVSSGAGTSAFLINGLDKKNLHLMLCHCSMESSTDSTSESMESSIDNVSMEFSIDSVSMESSIDSVSMESSIDSVSMESLIDSVSMESSIDIVSLRVSKIMNGSFQGSFWNSIANSPHDCAAVFHVLRHTSDCRDVKINLSNCGLTDKLITQLTNNILSNRSTGGKLQVSNLLLSGNKLTNIDLLSKASASFTSLEWIDLSNNTITDFTPLFLCCNRLCRISLSDNPLGVCGIQSLETAVVEGKLDNLEILLLSNALTDINGALLAKLLRAIASHCPRLMILDLSRNSFDVSGASVLDGLQFAESNAVTKVPAAIKYCKTLSVILDTNPLGSKCLNNIFKLLKSKTCPITDLDLSNTKLTTPWSVSTMSVLNSTSNKNNSLTFLYLNRNNLSGGKVLLLAKFVQECKSLKWLYCCRCSLTCNEIKDLLYHIKVYSGSHENLKMWYLRNNSIGDKGANALIDSLPTLFPSILRISLSCNKVSNKVKKTLKETNLKNSSRNDEPILQLWLNDKLEETRFGLPDEQDEPGVCGPKTNHEEQRTHTKKVKRSRSSSDPDITEGHRCHPVKSPRLTPQPVTEDIPILNVQSTLVCSADLTTPPQTPHGTPSGMYELETVTIKIEELKDRTKVTDSQLDTEIKENDMILLAPHFNNLETLCVQLKLTPAHEQDVKETKLLHDYQTAVDKALRLWRKANPGAATYRALVERVLRMEVNGTAIAEKVCKFSASESSPQEHEQSTK